MFSILNRPGLWEAGRRSSGGRRPTGGPAEEARAVLSDTRRPVHTSDPRTGEPGAAVAVESGPEQVDRAVRAAAAAAPALADRAVRAALLR
ncbi:hypothetical protein, partial [Kitasatospora sp. P5_F3]